jgi:hypothetical protein
LRKEALLERHVALDSASDMEGKGRGIVRQDRILWRGVVQLPNSGKVAAEQLPEGIHGFDRRFTSGFVLEGLDLRYQIGSWIIQHPSNPEARASQNHNVRTPVRELLIQTYLGDAADRVSHWNIGLREYRYDAEPPVGREDIGQHAAVPRLKDVQRKRVSREEHDREWKDGQPEGHAER